MDRVWSEIIRDALVPIIEQTGLAVAGAKLRDAVVALARQQGLDFPPPEIRKFSELVESFPSEFIVKRRPGSDILVVPSSRPELLLIENSYSNSIARIRQDIFEALIRVPMAGFGLPYYEPSKDALFYLKSGEQAPASAVKLPATSLQAEIELREKFIDGKDVPEGAKGALKAGLDGGSPLRKFSQAVKEYGMARHWHAYRMSIIATRLREWAVQNNLPWQQSWVVTTEQRAVSVLPQLSMPSDERQQFAELTQLLTDADIARITIPMDIVLRMLSFRNRN